MKPNFQIGNTLKGNPSAIAIGKFGVFHKGHEGILIKLIDYAKRNNLTPTIFSFYPSPALFFSKNTLQHNPIFSLRQKFEITQKLGISLFLQKFSVNFSQLNPEDFIYLLTQKFQMKYLIVGEDFTFGANRMGNVEILNILSKKYNFELHISNSITENNENISTTNLRNLIQDGKIAEFNNHLGFNLKFEIYGKVMQGLKLAGSILGLKTANILLRKNIVMPKFGVYSCAILYNGEWFNGIANIGIKPTLDKTFSPMLEVNIFNFNENIYGKTLRVYLQKFVREEIKFENLEALKLQIERDYLIVKSFFPM